VGRKFNLIQKSPWFPPLVVGFFGGGLAIVLDSWKSYKIEKKRKLIIKTVKINLIMMRFIALNVEPDLIILKKKGRLLV
jgi:hypothetical protein